MSKTQKGPTTEPTGFKKGNINWIFEQSMDQALKDLNTNNQENQLKAIKILVDIFKLEQNKSLMIPKEYDLTRRLQQPDIAPAVRAFFTTSIDNIMTLSNHIHPDHKWGLIRYSTELLELAQKSRDSNQIGEVVTKPQRKETQAAAAVPLGDDLDEIKKPSNEDVMKYMYSSIDQALASNVPSKELEATFRIAQSFAEKNATAIDKDVLSSIIDHIEKNKLDDPDSVKLLLLISTLSNCPDNIDIDPILESFTKKPESALALLQGMSEGEYKEGIAQKIAGLHLKDIRDPEYLDSNIIKDLLCIKVLEAKLNDPDRRITTQDVKQLVDSISRLESELGAEFANKQIKINLTSLAKVPELEREIMQPANALILLRHLHIPAQQEDKSTKEKFEKAVGKELEDASVLDTKDTKKEFAQHIAQKHYSSLLDPTSATPEQVEKLLEHHGEATALSKSLTELNNNTRKLHTEILKHATTSGTNMSSYEYSSQYEALPLRMAKITIPGIDDDIRVDTDHSKSGQSQEQFPQPEQEWKKEQKILMEGQKTLQSKYNQLLPGTSIPPILIQTQARLITIQGMLHPGQTTLPREDNHEHSRV